MKINIITVGKIKENYIKTGMENYIKRMKRFCDINIYEVKSEKAKGSNLTGAQIEKVKKKESERVYDKVPENDYIIALSVKGKPMTSEGLAQSIQNLQVQGNSNISFLVGGPMGLSDEILEKADYTLSLSHMTFTHQMIRLILLEQLYRAFKIINGEPYHK
ncbi:MAG: 23S rRNA (pseudouridine(1915)-N(3))-methyltransferase RlmH [Halanaerobiales bacterium]